MKSDAITWDPIIDSFLNFAVCLVAGDQTKAAAVSRS